MLALFGSIQLFVNYPDFNSHLAFGLHLQVHRLLSALDCLQVLCISALDCLQVLCISALDYLQVLCISALDCL